MERRKKNWKIENKISDNYKNSKNNKQMDFSKKLGIKKYFINTKKCETKNIIRCFNSSRARSQKKRGKILYNTLQDLKKIKR